MSDWSLRHCPLICESDLSALNILEHSGWESACAIELVCHVWRSLVHHWFSQLKAIQFSNYRASDIVIRGVLLKCSSLRSLEIVRNNVDLVSTPLEHPFLLTDASVQVATESCKRLEHIHLEVMRHTVLRVHSFAARTVPSLTAKSFEMIATNCPQLKSLTVKNCTCFEPNAFLQVIKFCTQLRAIKLTHNCGVKFFEAFAMQCGREVRSLYFNFAGVSKADKFSLLHLLLKSCPKLEALNYYGVEWDMMQAIKLNSTQWRALELGIGDTAIRDLASLFQSHSNLQELYLVCDTLHVGCVSALGQCCKNLTKFSLYSKNESLVNALQEMPGNFLKIRSLRLLRAYGNDAEELLRTDRLKVVSSNIQNLTLRGFSTDSLLELMATFPHLQKLKFVGRITKRREQECLEKHALRELHLRYWTHTHSTLDQDGFRNVIMHLPKLEVFSVEMRILNHDNLALLDQRCPSLRSLYVSGMVIDGASMRLFHEGFRSLQVLDLGYISKKEYCCVLAYLRFRRPLLQVSFLLSV